jgi:site-specific recombinase XerD
MTKAYLCLTSGHVGVDLVTVKELLGHAGINMTVRYSHLVPEHKAQAVAKLEER